MIFCTRAYARVGLMGNPSDGYFGKTLSATVTDFRAEVTLWESPEITIVPHPIHDPLSFSSLEEVARRVRQEGYYGGIRLLYATCKKFYEFCTARGVELPKRNFTVRYDTTIPRQIGLGGSSAIITATIRALMQFYELQEGEHYHKPEIPNLILSVETEELDIAAGLQDRVVQWYGGLVFMDFSEEYMLTRGYGEYEPLDPRLLPPLFLAYQTSGKESGRVHRNIRYRFEQGDPEVRGAMREFAQYAVEAREALLRGDHETFGVLMNRNFDLRRKLYGDKALGERNLEMIEIARRLGFPSKFSGSGDAIVGMYRCPEDLGILQAAYESRGYHFRPLSVEVPNRDDAGS
ncbi:MAG: hypothetical protein KatS3mg115_0013 [Candidatus Poribacteria bacterium]|nr:MAG: hypothetical protein KatS3mg115_0013 [Candidatus Poribacteria bacterium]